MERIKKEIKADSVYNTIRKEDQAKEDEVLKRRGGEAGPSSEGTVLAPQQQGQGGSQVFIRCYKS